MTRIFLYGGAHPFGGVIVSLMAISVLGSLLDFEISYDVADGLGIPGVVLARSEDILPISNASATMFLLSTLLSPLFLAVHALLHWFTWEMWISDLQAKASKSLISITLSSAAMLVLVLLLIFYLPLVDGSGEFLKSAYVFHPFVAPLTISCALHVFYYSFANLICLFGKFSRNG